MPVKVEKRDGKFRIVDSDADRIETNKAGSPVDGGGHETEEAADRQARAINADLRRRGVIEALALGLPGFVTDSPSRTPEQLQITIGSPVGPFKGVTSLPVGVLEALPAKMLKRLESAGDLFWVPVDVAQVTQSSHAVVRKIADGYGVFIGSRQVSSHKTRDAALQAAATRNRMMRAELPGDLLGEEVVQAIADAIRQQVKQRTGETNGHDHLFSLDADSTDPGGSDDHSHPLPRDFVGEDLRTGPGSEDDHDHVLPADIQQVLSGR